MSTWDMPRRCYRSRRQTRLDAHGYGPPARQRRPEAPAGTKPDEPHQAAARPPSAPKRPTLAPTTGRARGVAPKRPDRRPPAPQSAHLPLRDHSCEGGGYIICDLSKGAHRPAAAPAGRAESSGVGSPRCGSLGALDRGALATVGRRSLGMLRRSSGPVDRQRPQDRGSTHTRRPRVLRRRPQRSTGVPPARRRSTRPACGSPWHSPRRYAPSGQKTTPARASGERT